MHSFRAGFEMPRFDPSPWNLGLPACAIAVACGPVVPLEPMGPTSLGETDPDPISTTDDGVSTDDSGCNPPCSQGYYCSAGSCLPYGCLEFGCCYDDPCCGEGPCCYEYDYGCEDCYAVTDCGYGSFCEYQACVPIALPPSCDQPLAIVEVLGPTPSQVDTIFSLAFVEIDGDVGRELVIGDENGAVLVGGPGEAAQLLPVPDDGLVEDIASADFDVDGREDIAISTTAPGLLPRLIILRNDGEGAFTAIDPATSAAFDIATADIDGDGLPDIVGALDAGVAYRPLGVLRNTGGLTFTPSFLAIDAQPLDIDLGDLDANGLAEVAGVDNVQQQVWFGASPLDTVPDISLIDVPYVAVQMVLADFDGNGYDDIVRLSNVQGWSLVDGWEWSIEQVFETNEWGQPGETLANTARAGDLDADGHADLLDLSGFSLRVRYGADEDLFGCMTQVNLPMQMHLIAVGDFTGDGREDVAVSNGTVVYVYETAPP